MDADVIQIGTVFITISLIIPSFLISLVIPYQLDLWSITCKEIDMIQEKKLYHLSKIRKMLEADISMFRRTLIEMVVFSLGGFCSASFIFGLATLAGWIDSLLIPPICLQLTFGILSWVFVGYGAFLLVRLLIKLKQLKHRIRVIIITILGYCSLGLIIGALYFTYLFIRSLTDLMLVILFIQGVLLYTSLLPGFIAKPTKMIERLRRERLEDF